eukprot:5329481-Alexandrium_andersonii.AAC.1
MLGPQADSFFGRGHFPRLGLKNATRPPPPEWAGEGAELRVWAVLAARVKDLQRVAARCPEACAQAIIPLRALRR